MSVLKALGSMHLSSGTSNILDILKLTQNLQKKGYNIELFWIPTHVGIKYNEKADEIAKDVIISDTNTSNQISIRDLRAQ